MILKIIHLQKCFLGNNKRRNVDQQPSNYSPFVIFKSMSIAYSPSRDTMRVNGLRMGGAGGNNAKLYLNPGPYYPNTIQIFIAAR